MSFVFILGILKMAEPVWEGEYVPAPLLIMLCCVRAWLDFIWKSTLIYGK